MDKAKAKNGKLAVEVGLFSILIFLSIVYTTLSNYSVTEEAYLRSKNEMIDRDLKSISGYIQELTGTPWLWRYAKEHPEDITRPLTDEEQAFSESAEVEETLLALLQGEGKDFEAYSPELQLVLARSCFWLIAGSADYNVRELQYADISYMEFPGDGEVYLYLRCNADEIDPLTVDTAEEFYSDPHFACLQRIDYPSAEHAAVKEILNGKLGPEQTVYEAWSDPKDGKDYYIGYIPVAYEGTVPCYLCVRYDWSTFNDDLVGKVIRTMIGGFLILMVLNALLILLIRKRATNPLTKVKNSMQTYMADKDSGKVHEAMGQIKCRNEIGVLADSFSDLAVEIDRYTEENLRLSAEKERIATELSLATSIQEDALPSQFPDRPEFEIYASMDPAKQVGGDFYDFFMIDEDHLALVIADVSGKGIPAALFMMSSKILINDHAMMGGTPAEILERVNKQAYADNHAHMFVTVWLGILEISTGKLVTSSAGHEYPMLNVNGSYEMLKDKHGLAVGAMRKSKYTNTEIQLKKGDSIFVYTDGVAEATDAENQLFGTDRTLEALNAIPGSASQKEVLTQVRAAVDAFVKEAPQFDDLTMLGLKYYGPDGNADTEEPA